MNEDNRQTRASLNSSASPGPKLRSVGAVKAAFSWRRRSGRSSSSRWNSWTTKTASRRGLSRRKHPTISKKERWWHLLSAVTSLHACSRPLVQVGPRFAEPNSFQHSYGQRWKQLLELYKQKMEAVQRELRMEEEKLVSQMEYARFEHETEMLRERN